MSQHAKRAQAAIIAHLLAKRSCPSAFGKGEIVDLITDLMHLFSKQEDAHQAIHEAVVRYNAAYGIKE